MLSVSPVELDLAVNNCVTHSQILSSVLLSNSYNLDGKDLMNASRHTFGAL